MVEKLFTQDTATSFPLAFSIYCVVTSNELLPSVSREQHFFDVAA